MLSPGYHRIVKVSWYAQEIGSISGELCAEVEQEGAEGAAGDGAKREGRIDLEMWVDLKLACAFKGLKVLEDIISVEEEAEIVARLDSLGRPGGNSSDTSASPLIGWSQSQSGRRKIEFGPKVNFKSEKVPAEALVHQ
jgi:hypothetical protein